MSWLIVGDGRNTVCVIVSFLFPPCNNVTSGDVCGMIMKSLKCGWLNVALLGLILKSSHIRIYTANTQINKSNSTDKPSCEEHAQTFWTCMEVQHTMEPHHGVSMFTVGSAWASYLPTLILNNILNPARSGFMTLVSTDGYFVLCRITV